MDFNKLDTKTKESLHEEFSNYAQQMGGANFFLNIVEEIRALKPNGLLNTSAAFHTKKARISLSKAIYKDTLTTLFEAIRKEERDGDMLDGANPKEYKATMNIIRALKPVTVTFESKESEGGSFTFNILDTSVEKKTKVTFAFKTIFFYHLDEIKKVLFYKAK
ncbi:hypothetical protein [Halarcobacter ebronensis]|uniref:Uncharacterized protein n=1 Tax=Halarcobacter ebronensis TaxID=1462615 RepID=A0A4Q1ALL9_9BACT|nr:hypothetical protein [Halarcobacter ebronensis]QKF82944.1 hypothetical protein AEBR_2477 [Halarcobacter ebronensis]RXK02858.1 hypothetical protein CRV07_13300 [Halarcobacter ebronensis]